MSQIDEISSPDNSTPSASELSAQSQYDKCMALAHNLWWTWHPDVINLFRDLDPIRWRQLDHNPIALLREFTPDRLAARSGEMVLFSRINHAYRRLKEYASSKQTWLEYLWELRAFGTQYRCAAAEGPRVKPGTYPVGSFLPGGKAVTA